MKDFSKLTLILFTIICLNIVSCDTTTEEKKSEEKQSTTLQNLINNANDGDTINLEEWENVTDYTATIDKKLTITSGNLNGASLTVKAENVKLEKMQNLSVETSSRLTIKDSKLNNLLLDGNAQSRSKTTAETVVLLSKGEIDSKKVRVEFSLEDMDMSDFQDKATYTQIKDYVLEHSGLKVSNLYISQIKRKCGLEVGKNYNLPKAEDSRQPQCPSEKENAIREAMKYFGMI
jgi:hypothetical protein